MKTRLVGAIVAALAITVATIAPLTAEASSGGWSITRTPNPVEPNGSLPGVSCAAPADCVAVGSAEDPAGNTMPLAEHWNGASWSIEVTPHPSRSPLATLNGVSCVASADCTAVGREQAAGGVSLPLAERWDGKAWTVQPTPPIHSGSLASVSCPTTTSCAAVGTFSSASGVPNTLAEHWNGTVWTLQPTPNPGGPSSYATLSSVSCSTPTACTAVGSTTSPGFGAVAERWNGNAWALQTTPVPADGLEGFLNAVSCTPTAACIAVGYYINSTFSTAPLVERWGGSTWALLSVPLPSGATSPNLVTVSCSSSAACTAVGDDYNTVGDDVPLVERWNGSTWRIQSTPGFPTFLPLDAVSCPAAARCIAVGSLFGVLVAGWDGVTWTVQHAPRPSGADYTALRGVSCTAARACSAVGWFDRTSGTSAGNTPIAERWDGTSWTLEPTPRPAAAVATVLNAVACTSSTACTATGSSITRAFNTVTLAERWDGTHWTIQSTPNPSGSSIATLLAVSCPTGSACTAVGQYYTSLSNNGAFAERWDGHAWAIQTTPVPPGARLALLKGVSCTSATACVAVGGYVDSRGTNRTLAERWDGSTWSIQPTPTPIGVQNSRLNAVSCTAPTACTAVGRTKTSGVDRTLAERWDGSTWSIQPVPQPAGALVSDLDGVSCAAANVCTAVGAYQANDATQSELTLAAQWDGTSWTIPSTPNPSGSSNDVLVGVSCPAIDACMAAGSDRGTAGISVSLAEGYSG
jgi:hypothetical protein